MRGVLEISPHSGCSLLKLSKIQALCSFDHSVGESLLLNKKKMTLIPCGMREPDRKRVVRWCRVLPKRWAQWCNSLERRLAPGPRPRRFESRISRSTPYRPVRRRAVVTGMAISSSTVLRFKASYHTFKIIPFAENER